MVAITILKVNGFSQEIVLFSGDTVSLKIEVFSLYFNILKEYRSGRSAPSQKELDETLPSGSLTRQVV